MIRGFQLGMTLAQRRFPLVCRVHLLDYKMIPLTGVILYRSRRFIELASSRDNSPRRDDSLSTPVLWGDSLCRDDLRGNVCTVRETTGVR